MGIVTTSSATAFTVPAETLYDFVTDTYHAAVARELAPLTA